jgi:hypothetical protein
LCECEGDLRSPQERRGGDEADGLDRFRREREPVDRLGLGVQDR